MLFMWSFWPLTKNKKAVSQKQDVGGSEVSRYEYISDTFTLGFCYHDRRLLILECLLKMVSEVDINSCFRWPKLYMWSSVLSSCCFIWHYYSGVFQLDWVYKMGYLTVGHGYFMHGSSPVGRWRPAPDSDYTTVSELNKLQTQPTLVCKNTAQMACKMWSNNWT